MRIIYSDEEEFHTECSKGNIFVEIPKFYCKREQIDGYEYLLISGTEQEGYIMCIKLINKVKFHLIS
jgi:hypothetical protein